MCLQKANKMSLIFISIIIQDNRAIQENLSHSKRAEKKVLSIYFVTFSTFPFLIYTTNNILTSAKSNVCENLTEPDYVLSNPTLSKSIFSRNLNM